MATPYPGAAQLLWPSSMPLLFVRALRDLPDAPSSWPDLAGVLLPYQPASVDWASGGELVESASLRWLRGEVLFMHPNVSGPLSIGGLAIGTAADDGWIIAVCAIDPPVVTQRQGDTVTIPVSLLVLADTESGG